MKSLNNYINEVLVKQNLKANASFEVYKQKIFRNYYVKVNSPEDVKDLCKAAGYSDQQINNTLSNFDKYTYKYGSFIRPSEKIVYILYCEEESEIEEYEYITNISLEDFNTKYWKKNKWPTL